MKKTFSLTAPNKKPDRQVEFVKSELNKYIARERRKSLPPGTDFWDFDCKFGLDASSANGVHVAEINKKIDEIVLQKAPAFYVEIVAKQGRRLKKPDGKGKGTAELMAEVDAEEYEDSDVE